MMSDEVLSYQFDDVIIDLRAGRVLRGGSPVALEPKAYDLLVLLASRSGELVTRQEVLDRVWAGVYVTDNAVARVVAQVRRVLGDSARGSRTSRPCPPGATASSCPSRAVTGPPPIDSGAGQSLGRRRPDRTGAARAATSTGGPAATGSTRRAGRPPLLGGRAGRIGAGGDSSWPGARRMCRHRDRPCAGRRRPDAAHLVGRARRLPGLVPRWPDARLRQRPRAAASRSSSVTCRPAATAWR